MKDKKIFRVPIFRVLKSHYCKFVFLISAIGLSLLLPRKVYYGYYWIIAILFIITTSSIITCFVRSVKEKVYSAKRNGASLLGIIATIFGFGALQACTVGAPVCGAYLSTGILALIVPGFAFNFFERYSLSIIAISIVVQLIALYHMGCIADKPKKN
ncbi:MAG: hypothetical protein QXW00_02105 [Candidatus Woesearchaeota archaeon]